MKPAEVQMVLTLAAEFPDASTREIADAITECEVGGPEDPLAFCREHIETALNYPE